MPKFKNINPDPSERAVSRGVTLNIRTQTLNIPTVTFPGMLPALTVEVVDQLRVRFAAGRPGHGPGEEQPHECQHGAGRQPAHPTGTAAACGESGGSELRQSSSCLAETHPAPAEPRRGWHSLKDVTAPTCAARDNFRPLPTWRRGGVRAPTLRTNGRARSAGGGGDWWEPAAVIGRARGRGGVGGAAAVPGARGGGCGTGAAPAPHGRPRGRRSLEGGRAAWWDENSLE